MYTYVHICTCCVVLYTMFIPVIRRSGLIVFYVVNKHLIALFYILILLFHVAKSKGFSLKTLVSPTVLIKMDKPSIDRIYSASKFFQLCVTAIPKMSTEILIGLSCNHHLPSRLWYFICNVIGVHVKNSVPAMLSPETDQFAPILMIICQITQYLLR